jgi:uncharacterized protein YegJ (DUF2314 family)
MSDEGDAFDRDDDEPLFMALRKDDPELLQAVSEARATVGRFRDLIANCTGTEVFHSAKLRFLDPSLSETLEEDRYFFVWVHFVTVDGDSFVGRTIQPPTGCDFLSAGQTHRFKASDIHDWMVNEDGRIHGGYSLRVMRKHLPEERRAAYDRYIGAVSYE